MTKFQSYLEMSRSEKRGINIYIAGGTLTGVVTNIENDTVELTSNEYRKIFVPAENILAVALY